MNPFYELTLDQQLQAMENAAKAALPYWNLENAELQLIKHRENAVYKATSPEGSSYAIRVHRLGYHTDAELNSELQWMEALSACGVDTPNVLHASDQSLFKLIPSDQSNQPFQVDVQEWFDGVPLGDMGDSSSIHTQSLSDNYFKIGQIAARTHNQACNWQEPPGFVRHAWDIDGLTGENPFWGRFWEIESASPEQRQALLKCRDKLRQELTQFGTPEDCFSLIHADFLPENILVNEGGIRLIDFDDAGYGWHLFDLATSLVFLTGTPEFDTALTALLAGYMEERPISDEHLASLPLFIFARWTTYVGWAHTRSETETAQLMTPMLIDSIDEITSMYLDL